jgi:hypothetical protein
MTQLQPDYEIFSILKHNSAMEQILDTCFLIVQIIHKYLHFITVH